MNNKNKYRLRTKSLSSHSLWGLNTTNFLLAGMTIVIIPFLAVFLKGKNWNYDQIGMSIATASLGLFLFQIIAGVIIDQVNNKRLLLAISTLLLGAVYALLPFISHYTLVVYLLIFISGIAGAFIVPLLASIALSLVGQGNLSTLIGINRSWNHLGNIAGMALAWFLVRHYGINAIFYFIGIMSCLSVISIYTISAAVNEADLTHNTITPPPRKLKIILNDFNELFKNHHIRLLIICVTLFHIANAPLIPLLSLYIKHLHGNNEKIAGIVFITQLTMVPISLITARFSRYHEIKKILSLAFILLPIRIFLLCITTNTNWLLVIQILDGIGTGIYGVAICLLCENLALGKKVFNTLLSTMQTALALGGLFGVFIQGFLLQYFGFFNTFLCLALIAVLAAILFVVKWAGLGETLAPQPH
ncbi:putative 3-phenylpropionic acid transporter [Legionella massiliensis]|uniref:Putative 3-phenylpropionic acid transporter n=1 Tax=Legionella massiliensis TaxID=1034943 RepID=A0A078L2Q7_9GAMM|nr:MFS transporter [Legionella massiliensis]CDZ79507.1 putative 3-phenylpropionic acid transporter [Legionella massiliensis]CEE15245.1 putative 3-phenylpropionic acid transporter [Legionella massiliensis]